MYRLPRHNLTYIIVGLGKQDPTYTSYAGNPEKETGEGGDETRRRSISTLTSLVYLSGAKTLRLALGISSSSSTILTLLYCTFSPPSSLLRGLDIHPILTLPPFFLLSFFLSFPPLSCFLSFSSLPPWLLPETEHNTPSPSPWLPSPPSFSSPPPSSRQPRLLTARCSGISTRTQPMKLHNSRTAASVSDGDPGERSLSAWAMRSRLACTMPTSRLARRPRI